VKALICLSCEDIIAPYRTWDTDRRWRFCQCGQAAARWRDGERGLLEVTAAGGADQVRVLGLNNLFLASAVAAQAGRPGEQWRVLHAMACTEIQPRYLFHTDARRCWVVVLRPAETSDVLYVADEEVSRV
jgi:hypothetical protein